MTYAYICILIPFLFILAMRAVYLILYYTSGKRENFLRFKDFLQMDLKVFPRVKSLIKPSLVRLNSWWKNSFIPGCKQSSRKLWTEITRLGIFFEILTITIWAIYVGRAYLNMDGLTWPSGLEFPFAIQTHYIWTNLPVCGACVFWNGFTQGGAPAFADIHGSMLYPLVIFFTSIMGPLNGAKLTLIASLIMGGIGQWWLSKIMGFGRIPRLWSGLLAVVSAHLAARMDSGAFGVMLSTAACSFIIAPGVALGLTGKRRYSILLGITLGLAFLSGQGYMQVGMVLSILPAFLVFMPGREVRLKNIWKEYLLAGFIAFLIAAIFLIPEIHFYPNISKHGDTAFKMAQNIRFIPLNHLINDVKFYLKDSLIPYSSAHLYANFLGWIPILLAIVAWRFIPRSRFRLLAFLGIAILLNYLTASADLLKLIALVFPQAAGVRFSGIIAGLANPLILGLSAWGLDAILQLIRPKPGLISPFRSISGLGTNIALLILLIPLIWSIKEAYDFSQTWLHTSKIDQSLYTKVEYLKTDRSEWINLTYGNFYWMIPALDTKLKIGNGSRAWVWNDHETPPINQEMTYNAEALGDPDLIRDIDGLYYLAHYENEYAYIQSGDNKTICNAQAVGGNIDVKCPESEKGQLIVYENNWDGWTAQVDHSMTPLIPSTWLSTDAPAGKHTYQFRYRPWDVWVGIFLTAMGIGLSIFLWIRAERISSSLDAISPDQS